MKAIDQYVASLDNDLEFKSITDQYISKAFLNWF